MTVEHFEKILPQLVEHAFVYLDLNRIDLVLELILDLLKIGYIYYYALGA